MSFTDPDIVLPASLIAMMALVTAALSLRTLLTDARRYDDARRRTGSAKRAVLGLVSPEHPAELDGDVERGFALGYHNQKPFIVLNGKLPLDHVK